MYKPRLMGLSLIMLLVMILVAGCLTDPEKKETPTEEPAEFRDLTSRDDVIYNLLLSYAEKNIIEYSRLLLADGDSYNGSSYPVSYYWYNQPEATELDEYILRDQDITCTNNLFLAAKGTPAKPDHQVLDDLTLEIRDGSWNGVSEIFGEPCEDCWFTERNYELRLYLGEGTWLGTGNIQLYIVPVDEGGKKIYKIAMTKDIYVE